MAVTFAEPAKREPMNNDPYGRYNEITHDKPLPSIEGSGRFILSYMDSLLAIKQHPHMDMDKGKAVISYEIQKKKKPTFKEGNKVKKMWLKPPPGELKLNVDAFKEPEARAGIVLRDHEGEIVFAAWLNLRYCADATEEELAALTSTDRVF
jgi:hypothetical protein